jgi:membrane protease YdiL (CAAX protease family)
MLLLAGLGTAALSTWPVMSVSLANLIHPSQTAPWRQAFFDMSWRRWEFWLFSAVMSWALVPVVEELFFRGYCQRRLAEDWGDGPAIIGTACFFTFAHAQYQIPNLYNGGMIVGLLISALGFGAVFAWTRSLIPGIIAHALIDIPMTVPWEAARGGADDRIGFPLAARTGDNQTGLPKYETGRDCSARSGADGLHDRGVSRGQIPVCSHRNAGCRGDA